MADHLDLSLAWVVVAVLAVGTAADAQVTITGVATTDLEARASSGTPHVLPAGTVLTSHRLSSSGLCAGFATLASLNVALTGATVTYGTYASSICANGASASGVILLTLSAATPTAGSLHLDSGQSSGSYSVDIGNDGSIEFGGSNPLISTQAAAFPLVVDAAGIQVLVRAQSSAATIPFASSSSTDLTLTFATDGIVVPYGSACGPELAARYYTATGLVTVEDFDFTATNSPVTPYAFFVLGVQPLNLVIPPLSCVLRTGILVPVPTTVSPAGKATWNLPVPPGIGPVDVRVQYLAATVDPTSGAVVWRTSEAMRLRLP